MFAFTSERKAMTVIMRNVLTNKVYAFVKGADSSILPKCTHIRGQTPKSNVAFGRANQPPVSEDQIDKATRDEKQRVDDKVEEYAKLGLRTLCYAMKEIVDFPTDLDP